MNLTNYHSHCSFCDGKAPLEDFVKSAINAGFDSYGVSSHAPLPFETKWTISSDRVPDYLEEVKQLREKYKEEIELYVGLEIDYLNESQNPSIDYFRRLPLDYRIGSVHLIYTPEGEVIDTDTKPDNFRLLLERHFQGDLKQMISLYLDASMRMVEAGGFDFVGHADKISYNAGLCDPALFNQGWYNKKLSEYLTLIAEKEIMMEINTKAYALKGCFFPHVRHFRQIRELGIPVLVNSDTHLPELVNSGRQEALLALKEAGFLTVRELHGGVWQDIPIEL